MCKCIFTPYSMHTIMILMYSATFLEYGILVFRLSGERLKCTADTFS